MAYFINQTRMAEVLINGTDFTQFATEINLTDSSGIKNGLIATDGEIKLKYIPGSTFPQDYKRNAFRRGDPVRISVQFPSGVTRRHPRGYLFVISSKFEPETESIVVEVGCTMALRALAEDVEALIDQSDLYISETRKDYSNLSNAMAAQSKILYYDNNNNLQSLKMYDGESQIGSAAPNFVSVFGLTAMSVQALDARSKFDEGGEGSKDSPYEDFDPDDVDLTYDWGPEVDEDGNPIPGTGPDGNDPPPVDRVDTTTTESKYYMQYPAIAYQRKPPEEVDNLDDAGTPQDDSGLEIPRPLTCVDEETNPNPDSPAIQTPGGVNGETSCMDNYETVRSPIYVNAQSTSISTSYYDGPNSALSYQENLRYGPALEANNQYFADSFQVCRQSWATKCQPNGQCSTAEGTEEVLLSKDTRETTYNEDGSVASIIVDSFATRLSGAQPFNWRAGVENGLIVNFRTPLNPFGLYRVQRVETNYTYSKTGAKTVRATTTYTSVTSRQQGISGIIDALSGIITTQTETSLTNAVDPPRPPQLEEPEIPTEEETETLPGNGEGDDSRGSSAGLIGSSKIKVRERIGFPIIPIRGRTTAAQVIADYKEYIVFTIKGESLGLRIVEPLREDICTNWTPNQSFRYSDPRYDLVMSLRMDGTTWSIRPDSCLISTDGLAMGFSDGTLQVPNNVVGNTTPSFS